MFSTVLIATVLASTASASMFPIFPVAGSTCTIGTPCQVKWDDSADAPSTKTWGETTIDLVKGATTALALAQPLGGVSDPSVATALTFTPAANLTVGTDYAIRFVSKPLNSTAGLAFSTFFTIAAGSGNAASAATNATVSAATGSSSVVSNSTTKPTASGASASGTGSSRASSASSSASASASASGNSTSGANVQGVGMAGAMVGVAALLML